MLSSQSMATAVCSGILIVAASLHARGLEPGPDEPAVRPLEFEPHPYTTAPGVFGIELSAEFIYDRHHPDGADQRVQAGGLTATVKYGITPSADVQIVTDLFEWERTRDFNAGIRDTESGFGDITLRLKYNMLGNDGGDVAAAVTPFVRLPTARHDIGSRAVEGGVMVPTFVEIADRWTLEWTPQLAAIRDSADESYELEASYLIALTYVLSDELDAFAEFEHVIDTESGSSWQGVAGGGLTWNMHEDLVVEGGVLLGLTRSADDYGAFVGLATRF